MSRRRQFLLCLLLSAAAASLPAKVLSIPFVDLAAHAPIIVIGRVEEVPLLAVQRVAQVEVAYGLAGPYAAGDRLHYLAQPTWSCDITTAIVGEWALLFLVPDDEAPAGSPLRVAHAGRGRMPIHTAGGRDYASLWTVSLELPDHIEGISHPDSSMRSLGWSARLDQLVAFIAQTRGCDSDRPTSVPPWPEAPWHDPARGGPSWMGSLVADLSAPLPGLVLVLVILGVTLRLRRRAGHSSTRTVTGPAPTSV